MNQFVVEHGYPLPYQRSSYPFDQMEIGDSFSGPMKFYKKVSSAATNFKKNGKDFTVRKISDTRFRCWRIE